MHPRQVLTVGLAALLCACGTPGSNVAVNVPVAPVVKQDVRIAEAVGELLSSDARESEAALQQLLQLDESQRADLIAYRDQIPNERDPRWLNVLDEYHALPELDAKDQLDFLVWKAGRPEPFFVMKAQSRLLDMARDNPEALIDRLEAGGDGSEVLAVALALSGERRAVPALLTRYRYPQQPDERRAAVEALAQLVGEERRPRLRGTREEMERDALAIESWYQEQQALASAEEEEPPAEPEEIEAADG